MARHRSPSGPLLLQRSSGRRFQVNERKTESGGTVAMAADITEQKRVEEALRESEERFSSLVSHIAGAVNRCACDKDWTMEFMSAGIQNICRLTAMQLDK